MAMAIVCLDRSLRLDGYAFIGELALDGSVRPVTGVLPMARCLRAAGVRRLAVAEENAAEAALVDSLEVADATLRCRRGPTAAGVVGLFGQQWPSICGGGHMRERCRGR